MKEFKQAQIDALAIEIFNEFNGQKEGITMQEAQEMAMMELKEKQMRRYEKSDTPKKKATKERKVDYDKKYLLGHIETRLINETDSHNFTRKNESEISFQFHGACYTVKLIKHRQPK